MAELFAEGIVELLRRETRSEPEELSVDYFDSDELKDVRWLPTYLYKAGDAVWAIELARGDYIAPVTIQGMQAAATADSDIRPVVLVPRGERYDELRRVSEETGVPLAVGAETGYEMLRPGPEAARVAEDRPTRIPPALADKVGDLANVDEAFRQPLAEFSEAHRELRGRAQEDSDEEEEELLKRTFGRLIAADERFLGRHDPLAILHSVENLVRVRGDNPRDHYYHSFHNFLLGVVVIDSMYANFAQYHRHAFRNSRFSTEYAWLLTAMYHDLGYLIQHAPSVDEALYGDINVAGERTNALPELELVRRQEQWQSVQGKIHRRQLVSLYDHLTQDEIRDGWTAVTLLAGEVPDHPLDRALSLNFMAPNTHGAAGALRMIREIESRLRSPSAPSETQQFVMPHVYLAALSIPFHDWRLRLALREEGIGALSTRRFPLASLLMFIDSIQDDRRDPMGLKFEERDALQDIEVVDGKIRAVVDMGRVKSVEDKRTEARGVKSFLNEDGLKFEYPPEFLQ